MITASRNTTATAFERGLGMSYDDVRTEYYLTANGWIEGSRYYFRRLQGEAVERPEGTVEIWEHHVTQRYGSSREDEKWSCIWIDKSMSEEERSIIRNNAGPRPSR